MKNVELSNATLKAVASDSLELDWTPEDLSFTGFSLDSVSLNLDSHGLGFKASGTLSMSIDGISCVVPDNWMAGLGSGSFGCNLVLAGAIEIKTQGSQISVKLSGLKTSVMGNALTLSDISLKVDKDDLKDLTSAVKTELEKDSTGLFNKFWASQVINVKQVLSEELKDKSVSLDFKSLSLDVSNDIVAIASGQTLTFERSTISGSLSCIWTYSGVTLSLKASMTILGKATSVNATSNSVSDLAKLSSWVAAQGSALYQKHLGVGVIDWDWIRDIGSLLRSMKAKPDDKPTVAEIFKNCGYTASIASQAVNGAYQSGEGKVLSELYLAGYDTKELLDAMRYGMHLASTQFASVFKNTLHWGYRTVGIRMKSVGFSAIEIADGLNQSVFACTTTDIAKLFQHPEYGYKADDFDGASGHLFDVIKSHLDKGKSKGGGGFFKGPPGPGKPG